MDDSELSSAVDILKAENDRLKEELRNKPSDSDASLNAEIDRLKAELKNKSPDGASAQADLASAVPPQVLVPAAIVKEGYLWKEGWFHKKYRRRHFLLKGDQLYYQATVSGRLVDKGHIKLTKGVEVVSTNDPRDFNFSIKPPETKDRTYKLRAESIVDKAGWIAAIENALAAL